MPFVFGIAGTLLIVSGVRGTTSDLMQLIKADFTGYPNFLEWMVAIFIIGAIGYVKELSTLSRAFLILVLAGLFLSEKGVFGENVFSSFTKGIQSPSTSQPLGATGAQAITQAFNVPTPQTVSVMPSDTLSLPALPELGEL